MTGVDADQVLDQVDRLSADLLEEAAALVRIPSVGGTTGEHEAQSEVARRFGADGLDVDHWPIDLAAIADRPGFPGVEVERSEAWGLVGRLPGSGGGACLMLNGHIDVVPIGDRSAWTVDPFGGELRDGMLYGRGSCDMKAGAGRGARRGPCDAVRQAGRQRSAATCWWQLVLRRGGRRPGHVPRPLEQRLASRSACVSRGADRRLDAGPCQRRTLTFRLDTLRMAWRRMPSRRTEGVSRGRASSWPVLRALTAAGTSPQRTTPCRRAVAARSTLAAPTVDRHGRGRRLGHAVGAQPGPGGRVVSCGVLPSASRFDLATAAARGSGSARACVPPTPGCVTTPSRSRWWGGQSASGRLGRRRRPARTDSTRAPRRRRPAGPQAVVDRAVRRRPAAARRASGASRRCSTGLVNAAAAPRARTSGCRWPRPHTAAREPWRCWRFDDLGAELFWKVRGIGTTVAAVRLSTEGPLVLLAGHLHGEVPVLVYRVDDYDASNDGTTPTPASRSASSRSLMDRARASQRRAANVWPCTS